MKLGALASFAFVASITPGPNNVMLWASGLNFGMRRTIPHLAGVSIGFASLLLATALGIGAMFQSQPWLSPTLRVVGSAYLIYLAWRIATSGGTQAQDAGRPLSFLEAATFQYVNPKAWVMGITAAGSFIPPDAPLLGSALAMGALFWIVNLPCISSWALGGTMIGNLLTTDRTRRPINIALGLLLVATVFLINA